FVSQSSPISRYPATDSSGEVSAIFRTSDVPGQYTFKATDVNTSEFAEQGVYISNHPPILESNLPDYIIVNTTSYPIYFNVKDEDACHTVSCTLTMDGNILGDIINVPNGENASFVVEEFG